MLRGTQRRRQRRAPAITNEQGGTEGRSGGVALEKGVAYADIEERKTEGHTFHIHPPSHGALPLLACARYPPQPPVAVHGLAPFRWHRQGGRVRSAKRRLRAAREERVNVVNLGVRL